VPDVAVFLRDGRAENCGTHWRGGADFLVEVTSPGDQTRERLPFYARLGVGELLVVERQSWTLELYRQRAGQLVCVGQSTAAGEEVLASETTELSFRLVSGSPRPQISVLYSRTGQSWLV
jgi:Uma2 family endonuclease